MLHMSTRNFGLQHLKPSLGRELVAAYDEGQVSAVDLVRRIDGLTRQSTGFLTGYMLGLPCGFIAAVLLLRFTGRLI